MDSIYIKKTTYFIYFTALFAGFAFPVSGILSPQIAGYFGVKTTYVVFLDALVLTGLVVGNITSGRIIKNLKVERSFILSVFLLLLDQAGIATQNSLILYGALVFLFGFSMGILIPSVSYMIVSMFSSRDQSGSKLNIMNFFVGIGAFTGSAACGVIVHHSSWRAVYFLTGFLFLIIYITSCFFIKQDEKPDIKPKEKKNKKEEGRHINSSVILIGLAFIAYVYTEYIITYWFSPYLQKSLNYNVETVGFMLGSFWLSLALGRYIFGVFLIPRIKDYLFITGASLITIIGFFLFLLSNTCLPIFLTIILLGFGCSSIFPTLLGYGMKQTNILSPITMSFLVTSGSIGGCLSLLTSATLGSYLPYIFAIYMGPICCFGILVFVALTRAHAKR